MIKGIRIGNLAVDCGDAPGLRDFYARMLGWRKETRYGCPAAVSPDGFVLLFETDADSEYVSPVWPEEPGKQQKQMHFDFQVDDLQSAVGEAVSIGAAVAKEQYGAGHFVTLLDPEGHPFCLCAKD